MEFDGDSCFCFVGLGHLGFLFILFFYPTLEKKRRKKFQAAKCTLLSRFWFDFENTDKGRRAMYDLVVTPIRHYPSTKIASDNDRYANYIR